MLADIERIHISPITDGVCTSGGNEVIATLSNETIRRREYEITVICYVYLLYLLLFRMMMSN